MKVTVPRTMSHVATARRLSSATVPTVGPNSNILVGTKATICLLQRARSQIDFEGFS